MIDEKTRRTVAAHLADQQNIPAARARAMVDDAVDNGKDSPHALPVMLIIANMIRPILNEIVIAMQSPTPYSPEAIVTVSAAAAAVFPDTEEPS